MPMIPQASRPDPAAAHAELRDRVEGGGWDWFRQEFVPAVVADTFRPPDEFLGELSDFASTGFGERLLAWLHDLTDAAPYPQSGAAAGFEELALAAKAHQARSAVGRTISHAVSEGRRLRGLPATKGT